MPRSLEVTLLLLLSHSLKLAPKLAGNGLLLQSCLMPFSSEHYLHRYLCWLHRFYYINSCDVGNIYVDYIDIYVQMKRAWNKYRFFAFCRLLVAEGKKITDRGMIRNPKIFCGWTFQTFNKADVLAWFCTMSFDEKKTGRAWTCGICLRSKNSNVSTFENKTIARLGLSL